MLENIGVENKFMFFPCLTLEQDSNVIHLFTQRIVSEHPFVTGTAVAIGDAPTNRAGGLLAPWALRGRRMRWMSQ